MKQVIILVTGILFGIVLTKAEIISWYRIYEMFRFESFHMYGIIGSAIAIGLVGIQMIKRFKLKSMDGQVIEIADKPNLKFKPVVGGIIFGMGWALTGACPGPLYIILGNGYSIFFLVLGFVLLGGFVHGIVAKKLPYK